MRNHHGIKWFNGETSPKYFTSQLRQIIRCVRHIYVRGNEKASYLQNLLSRNIYNLEGISPAFKNLTKKSADITDFENSESFMRITQRLQIKKLDSCAK